MCPVKSVANVLLYANVTLIDDCKKLYKDRFKPGMLCAGRTHYSKTQDAID